MADEKRNEIKELIEWGSFQVFAKDEIPDDANVLPSRSILSTKTNDGQIVHKARFPIG